MNFGNIKYAIDHLTFKKVISAIIKKLKDLSDLVKAVTNDRTLTITDDNWSDYISIRPKILLPPFDVNGVTADVRNNVYNTGPEFEINNSGELIEKDTGNSKDSMFLASIYTSEQKTRISYFNSDEKLNYKNYLLALKQEAPSPVCSFYGNSNNNNGWGYINYYSLDSLKEIIKKKYFIKLYRPQLIIPNGYKKIIFDCRFLSFVGLSILPYGYKFNNVENTNDSSNYNENLNGTEITIFQNPIDGVDISSFGSLAIEVGNYIDEPFRSSKYEKELNSAAIKKLEQRVVLLDKADCIITAAYAKKQTSGWINIKENTTVDTENKDSLYTANSGTVCNLTHPSLYKTLCRRSEHWGGVKETSIIKSRNFWKLDKATSIKETNYGYDDSSIASTENLVDNFSIEYDNIMSLDKADSVSTILNLEASINDSSLVGTGFGIGNDYEQVDELTGTFIYSSTYDENYYRAPAIIDKAFLPRLRPGKPLSLIWSNGYWYGV